MIENSISIRVRYSETDQMSCVYHGNYAQYFDMGRTEWLRKLGITYKDVEEKGILLPLRNLNINYLKPARYDDLLLLKTTLKKLPTAKIQFDFKLYNQHNVLISTAEATLVFVSQKTGKPILMPKNIFKDVYQIFDSITETKN